jgi:hypothetical protein
MEKGALPASDKPADRRVAGRDSSNSDLNIF